MTSLVDLDAVTVAGYQLRTGDTTSAASAVTGALVEAESLLEEDLRRLLPLVERVESLRIHADGRMYPKAWPLEACATNTIDGRALLGGTPDVNTFVAWLGVDDFCITPRATITYTGGFDDGTDGTALPVTLAHAIYDIAGALVADRAPIPVGATSASVGDVSVGLSGGNGSGIDSYVEGLSERVKKYRNRWV